MRARVVHNRLLKAKVIITDTKAFSDIGYHNFCTDSNVQACDGGNASPYKIDGKVVVALKCLMDSHLVYFPGSQFSFIQHQ